MLAVDKIPTSKLEKRLEDVAHKWDEVKKLQPQVKSSVEPIQVSVMAQIGIVVVEVVVVVMVGGGVDVLIIVVVVVVVVAAITV